MKCESEFKNGKPIGPQKFSLGNKQHIEESPVNFEEEQEINQIRVEMFKHKRLSM
jgi:hypothetical protein